MPLSSPVGCRTEPNLRPSGWQELCECRWQEDVDGAASSLMQPKRQSSPFVPAEAMPVLRMVHILCKSHPVLSQVLRSKVLYEVPGTGQFT